MTIVFIEATGMFLALGAMTGRKVDADDVKRGLRADSLGTVIGAIFNTFPYVSYSQNIGLVGVTGVYSRWVCVAGGVIMLALGLMPKLAFIVASVPQCVLGGAGFIMFGMVAATGIKILSTVDLPSSATACSSSRSRSASALFRSSSPNFFRVFPDALKPIFGDGIILTSIAAVLLNAFFNRTSREQAEAETFSPRKRPSISDRRRDPLRSATRSPALQPDAAGLNAGEEGRVEANEGGLRGVAEPHRIARRWVEPLAFEVRAGLLERRRRCEAIGDAQKQRARVGGSDA